MLISHDSSDVVLVYTAAPPAAPTSQAKPKGEHRITIVQCSLQHWGLSPLYQTATVIAVACNCTNMFSPHAGFAPQTKHLKGKAAAMPTDHAPLHDTATVEQTPASDIAPAPPSTDATAAGQGEWEVKEDDFKTEYHPRAQKVPQYWHWEDYGRDKTQPSPANYNNRKPWQLFKSRIDFEFAEFALHAGLNHGQMSVLLDIVRRVTASPKDLSFESASDMQAAWETAKDKQPTVCIIYLYPSSSS